MTPSILQQSRLFIRCIFLKLQAFCKHKAQKPLIYKASGLYYTIQTLYFPELNKMYPID